MKSMTGYAKTQCVVGGRRVTVEIKTLNSKQMDATVKLPTNYRDKELYIRQMLNQLERGKIDFVLNEEPDNAGGNSLNRELVMQRYQELRELTSQIDPKTSNSELIAIIMQQSDCWMNGEREELSEEEWNTISKVISDSICEVDATRLHEGEIMKQDISKHIDLIESKMKEIPQYEKERIDNVRERLRNNLSEIQAHDVDENRFEQEIIYYLEKLDITEEKVRLAKHIDYFRNVMDNEPSCGKKLSFIAQEMGREINTTGSKANHVEIQKLVVVMKDELEKIKEQLGNIL
ncbi:MAG: YicC family protein [Bacteroidales bacterium]|nr:YicC family protein [Bacteroidales bacterium]